MRIPARSLLRRAAGFRRDERGNFALITGVSALAIMLSAGIAIDYTRIAHAKSVVNDALDAAVLAAGGELSAGKASGDQLERNFEDFFEANLENRSVNTGDIRIERFEADRETGKISAEARAIVKTSFMALTGTREVEIATASEATFSSDAIEIAMVLDVTGSMAEAGKLAALKQAATDAVGILLPDGTSDGKVRIGLVPYADSVNAGGYANTASDGRSNRCVTERGGPQAATDVSYAASPVLANFDRCPSQRVQALTSDREVLVDQIASFRADGYTAGQIGIAWGYYMLSENWRALWGAAAPARYSEPVKKVAIVMTDGEFNTYYYRVRGDVNRQEAKSGSAAADLCTHMKRDKAGKPGITVYSIAFQAPREAQTLLRACASPDSGTSRHYFPASDANELRQAFAAIALDIQKLRLSK